jgi:hypothetical protein
VITYLIVLAVFTNFFLMPTQGVGDGIGGWPIGQQNDSTVDTSLSSAPAEEPQTEESSMSLLTLLWEFTIIFL